MLFLPINIDLSISFHKAFEKAEKYEKYMAIILKRFNDLEGEIICQIIGQIIGFWTSTALSVFLLLLLLF